MKKYGIISWVLLCAVALVGCGPKAETPSMSALEIVAASQEAMNAVESYGFVMDTTMQMDIQGQEKVDIKMATTAQVIMKPQMLLRLDSEIEMVQNEDVQTMAIEQYIEGTETGLILYQPMRDQWSKVTMNDSALAMEMNQDPQEALALYQERMKSAVLSGEEMIGECKCYKIDMLLSTDVMGEALLDFSAVLDEAMLAVTQELLASMEGIEVTVWIDQENFQLLKQHTDISDIMRIILQQQAQGSGMTKTDIGDVMVALAIQYSDYNKIEEIIIPESAKAAEELVL